MDYVLLEYNRNVTNLGCYTEKRCTVYQVECRKIYNNVRVLCLKWIHRQEIP